MNDDYKEWYEEAIITSNELGFAGLSAADVIKYQAQEVDKLKRDIKDIEREYLNSDACFNAVIDYILNKGYMESPLEFLRCWNEGNFEALREEWPDAPEEIYLADPLYKEKK